MDKITRLLLAVSITSAMAFVTIYVFSQETPVFITEVLGCMLAAIICAKLE